jgi:hypothetical protein
MDCLLRSGLPIANNVPQVAAGQPAFLPTKDIKKRLAGGNLLCLLRN